MCPASGLKADWRPSHLREGATTVDGDDRTFSAVSPSLLSNSLASTDLSKGLTTAQLIELGSVCRERRFAPGEFILREGEPDPFVYVLVEGFAQLTKNTSFGSGQVPMGELRSGDVLGELKIVDPQPSSASVVATTNVTALAIDLDALAGSAALTDARATVLGNVGKILAERLRARTNQGADFIQHELEEGRALVHAGRFIVLMFAMIATYQLALAALVLVPRTARPPDLILAFVFVIWTVIPVALSLRHNPFPIASYGLTTRRGGKIASQALIWTIPLLVLVLALKLALLRWAPSMADGPLFDPAALFAGRPFDLAFYLFAIFLYAIHAPLQEFVARAGLQGTLQHFIPVPPGSINWKAICDLQPTVCLGPLLHRSVVLACGIRARPILGLDVCEAAFAHRRHRFSFCARRLGHLRIGRA